MGYPSVNVCDDDATLIQRWASGDRIAGQKLLLRHEPELSRFFWAQQPSDADDLTQETMLAIVEAVDRFRGEASFRGWLFRIGANLRKDEYRKNAGRVHLSIEDHDVADHSDPLGEAGASEMEARLRTGLRQLPRLQREVFLLRAQQGMEYEEICTALGTTPGAARVHYHHAVKRLKELMQ